MNNYDYGTRAWGLLDEVLSAFDQGTRRVPGVNSWRPRINAWDSDDSLVLEVELPGVTEKDLKVEVTGQLMTIEATRPDSQYDKAKCLRREFAAAEYKASYKLPDDIDVDSIKARLANGVLKLELKKKAELQPRQISIKVT